MTFETFRKIFKELYKWINECLNDNAMKSTFFDYNYDESDEGISINLNFETARFIYDIHTKKPSIEHPDGYLSLLIYKKSSVNISFDITDGDYSYDTWIDILKGFFQMNFYPKRENNSHIN
jgi:hypothetical protein